MGTTRAIGQGCHLAMVVLLVAWAGPAMAAKIACVGDSITWGWSVGGPTSPTSYPVLLQTLVGSQHSVSNFGYNGATVLKQGDVPYWNQTVYTQSTAWNPDIALILLGSNDAKSQNWQYSTNFPTDYASLIAHYRGLGANVYVMTPPPVYGDGRFGITPAVLNDQIVPIVRQIATSNNAPLIDIYTALSGHADYFPDSVHPNADGDALIAQTVAAVLVPATPSDLSATTVSGNQISLAWNASSNAISYNVKRSTTNGGPYTVIASGVTLTTYGDTSLTEATTYHYVVSAGDAIESSNSVQSSAMTATTLNVVRSGNTLMFWWTGAFKLQCQTNSPSTGLSINSATWLDYPDASNPVNVIIDPANPTVFFRLISQ